MPTIQAIKSILDARTLDSLVGLKEDSWFDAKRAPGYDFSTPQGRIELAKDVSGIANSEGGYIVLGLDTTVVVEESIEVVSALNLIARPDFDVSKFQGVLREHIYPEVIGLRVEWVEHLTTAGQGVGVIWVPPQDESKKFFLMKRVIEAGLELKQIVFGIAKRVGSSTDPFTVERLYEMTQRGNSDTAQRLTRIEEKVDSVLRAASQEKPAEVATASDIEARIKKLIES